MHPHQVGASTNKWWDGIHVICKNTEFEEVLPPVNTEIMFEEHKMMTQKYPLALYEAGMVASALRPFRPIKLVRRFVKLFKAVYQSKFYGEYDYLNTFSKDLDEEIYNK